jgi:hypothetical protein
MVTAAHTSQLTLQAAKAEEESIESTRLLRILHALRRAHPHVTDGITGSKDSFASGASRRIRAFYQGWRLTNRRKGGTMNCGCQILDGDLMARWMRRKLPSFTRYNESCEEAFSGPASALLLTRSSLEVLL